MSPEDLDEARQRLIASSSYKQMVDRVDGNSPFADLDGSTGSSSSRGVKEEEVAEAPSVSFLRQAARAAVDVAVAFVPVALVVTLVKFPPPVVEALSSAAAAVKASPLEPVRPQRLRPRIKTVQNQYKTTRFHRFYTHSSLERKVTV